MQKPLKMKLLIFAHTPPPHHGQSYMVELMVNGFGGDARATGSHAPNPFAIECYHVNARLSHSMEDIGSFRPWKVLTIVRHCLAAIACRFRHGVKTMYYVPAPGKNSALLRDWIVMAILRPSYPRLILLWHAAHELALVVDRDRHAAFAGREAVIPAMFSRLLAEWGLTESQAPAFVFYLRRHIELDGDGVIG